MLVMVQLQLQKTSSVPVYVPGLFYTTQHMVNSLFSWILVH